MEMIGTCARPGHICEHTTISQASRKPPSPPLRRARPRYLHVEAGLKSAFGGVFTVAAASVPVGEVLLQCLDATPGHLLYWREVAPTPLLPRSSQEQGQQSHCRFAGFPRNRSEESHGGLS